MTIKNNVASNLSSLAMPIRGATTPSEKANISPDNSAIIILKQEKPVSQRYFISGSVQIGRAHDLNWAVEDRKIPPQFQQLEAVISIDEAEYASRNHAGIYRDNDGKFYLIDLNSLNHTFVNGRDISSESGNPVPRMLVLDDVISIPEDLELKVVGFKNSNQNNHCFMVGGENLMGVRKNLDELEAQLIKRGFEGNVVKLYLPDATKERILERLEEATYLTTSDSHFIFYYSGHGDKKGLALDNLNTISPLELYSKLGNIRGKKAIILDCCHAGVFLSRKNKKKVPSNCLILTASSESGKAYSMPNDVIADGAYMGRFSAALVEYLDQNKGRIDLRDFKERLDSVFKSGAMSIYYQEPKVTGGRFTIMTACSAIKGKVIHKI